MDPTKGQDAPNSQDATTTGAQDAPQTTSTTPVAAQNVNELPEWAQRIIRDTRQEAKASREAREALERAQQAAESKRLEEQGEWQKIAEQRKAVLDALAPIKAKAEQADAVMQKLLDAQLERLSDDARDMVNTMPGDVQAKLDWLAANQGRLMRPAAPEMDAGARGNSAASIKLTPGQETAARAARMTNEQYISALLQMEQATKEN